MKEFWVSSGHHLTRRNSAGTLDVTDELLLGLLARPEVLPPDEACAHEKALHQALLVDPRRAVGADQIGLMEDEDARENWHFLIGFRDLLLAHRTIEASYLAIIKQDTVTVPPIFMAQLVHLILRNALDGCEDTLMLRAGELFFRSQKASMHDGHLLLVDLDLVESLSADPHQSPLLSMMGEQRIRELDILGPDNAYDYWSRSDAFSMVFDLSQRTSREALARVMARWVSHLAGVTLAIEPIETMSDEDWRWFIGLDSTGTRIGNALWNSEWMPDELKQRAVAFYRARIGDEVPLLPDVAGHPLYLILGMDADGHIMLKPQNLIAGLPLTRNN
jgi:hypothetical protein